MKLIRFQLRNFPGFHIFGETRFPLRSIWQPGSSDMSLAATHVPLIGLSCLTEYFRRVPYRLFGSPIPLRRW
jgi:hypothetical protein